MISPIGDDPGPGSRQGGFTLLELLVVILIMAVMVGVAAPRFSRTFSRLQLQASAYDMAKLLTYASKRAVARGEMLRIHFDPQGRRYWLAKAQEAPPAGEPERVGSKFGRISSVPEAISLEPSARAVTFYPDGRADPFEMFMLDRQHGYRLTIDVWTGRVTVRETYGKYRG